MEASRDWDSPFFERPPPWSAVSAANSCASASAAAADAAAAAAAAVVVAAGAADRAPDAKSAAAGSGGGAGCPDWSAGCAKTKKIVFMVHYFIELSKSEFFLSRNRRNTYRKREMKRELGSTKGEKI